MSRQREHQSLRDFARFFGIQTQYTNLQGEEVHASEEGMIAVLRALGHEIKDDFSNLADLVQKELRSELETGVPPVVVHWMGTQLLRVPLWTEHCENDWTLTLTPEDGKGSKIRLKNGSGKKENPPARWGNIASWTSADVTRNWQHCRVEFDLGADEAVIPPGYFEATLSHSSGEQREFSFFLISAPEKVYSPAPDHLSRNSVGVFMPLYSLRSERNWGIGDLTDLHHIYDWLSENKAGFVATLPLLAGFLERPFTEESPYAPLTRLFWNEIFLDVTRIEEFELSREAARLSADPLFKKRLRYLREINHVDYGEVMRMKRSILEPMAKSFFEAADADPGFQEFIGANPLVQDYARFRAACDQKGKPWQDWEPEAAAGRLTEGKDYRKSDYRYHLYVQYRTQQQLNEFAETSESKGLGLYLDYPTGVHPSGFDPWRRRKLFIQGLAAGAPPDPFFTLGQNWGFQPIHPEEARKERYATFRESLDAYCKSAGILRLDHVMSLHRMYCIPNGYGAKEGVYLRYPSEELYAILCVESQKTQTMVVGEDLGTVPSEVRSEMNRHGLLRMHVLQFDRFGIAPKKSISVLNTHDMPPLASFWHASDLALRKRFGFLKPEEIGQEKKNREKEKSEFVDWLRNEGILPEGVTANSPYSKVKIPLARLLAKSRSLLVQFSLEDFWGEREPQNVPGTWKEYPNWRRKMKKDVDAIISSRSIRSILKQVIETRQKNEETSS